MTRRIGRGFTQARNTRKRHPALVRYIYPFFGSFFNSFSHTHSFQQVAPLTTAQLRPLALHTISLIWTFLEFFLLSKSFYRFPSRGIRILTGLPMPANSGSTAVSSVTVVHSIQRESRPQNRHLQNRIRTRQLELMRDQDHV